MDAADHADIEASRTGDGSAFGRLVGRYQEAIAAQMHRFARDPATLEELVQDVFVEAYVSLDTYASRAPLLHWLRRIAVRVGYRHWKQRARSTEPLDDGRAETLADPGADADARETAEWVHAALSRLPPRDRLVLTLMSLDQLSVAETAELTGWSRTMVKVQAHRARAKLQRILETELRR